MRYPAAAGLLTNAIVNPITCTDYVEGDSYQADPQRKEKATVGNSYYQLGMMTPDCGAHEDCTPALEPK